MTAQAPAEIPAPRIADPELAAALAAADMAGEPIDHIEIARRLDRRPFSVKRSLARLAEAGLIVGDARPGARVDAALIKALKRDHAATLAAAQKALTVDADALESTSGRIERLTLDQLVESPLNPRQTFDQTEIEDLAADILDQGLLQNLLARPHPDGSGRYELAGGARRYRAMKTLEARGAKSAYFDPAAPVDVRVRPMSDSQMILVGISENARRVDVHPIEEGEAFLRLREARKAEAVAAGKDEAGADRDAGKVTAELGEALGRTRKWAQGRIRLAEGLAPCVREAFRAQEITTTQARAFATQPDFKIQTSTLETIVASADGAKDWPESRIQDLLHAEAFACVDMAFGETTPADVERVLFRPEDYDGPVYELEPEEAEAILGTEVEAPVTMLADVAQVERLQRAAMDAEAQAMKAERAFVHVTEDWVSAYEFPEADKETPVHETGVVFRFVRHTRRVRILDRRMKREDQPPPDQKAKTEAKAELAATAEAEGLDAAPEPFTRRHWVAAHEAKTLALQNAIAGDREIGAALALIATLQWFGGEKSPVLMARQDRRGEDRDFGAPVHLAKALAGGDPVAGLKVDAKTGAVIVTDPAAALHALIKRTDLDRLLACAMADRTGAWCFYQPGPGNTPLIDAIADLTGMANAVDSAAVGHPDAAYFKRFSRGTLIRIAQSEGVDIADMPAKAGEAAGWLALRLPHYTPPEWAFDTPQAVDSAVGALLTGKAPAGAAG